MVVNIITIAMVALIVVNLLAFAATLLARLPLSGARAGGDVRARVGPNSPPHVSVHIATYDEPPTMVIATLDALAALDYPSFDVLVIDNNTPDVAVWQPVEAHVKMLGPRFRFLHRDGVVGAKAGALNIALDATRSDARYVAVVDADYQVTPDFLTLAVAEAEGSGADFVQFPQAYRGVGRAQAVERELRAYFQRFPIAANAAGAPLLTGTLSLIDRRALAAAGGWPTATITEDAELGVRLWSLGLNGRYVDRVVGHGLLPVDLAGLRVQRQRWVAGNVQTLVDMLRQRRWGRRGVAAVVAQLTAWPNFVAVPVVALAWLALAGDDMPMASFVALIASVTLFGTLVVLASRAIAMSEPRLLLVKSALLWTSSVAWWPALFVRALRFRRTPKTRQIVARGPMVDTFGSALALVVAVALAVQGWSIAAALTALCAAGLVTGPIVDRSLRSAAA